jgi:predicted nucleic acid-binding protein
MGHHVSDMPTGFPIVSIDRDDDNFLYAAQAGGAEYIITDDDHLLRLGKFGGVPIGGPNDFFEWAEVNYPME